MKQIITVSNQTIFDLALQAYGNMEAAFQILEDNPQLAGMNDFPDGYSLGEAADFDISYPIKARLALNIQDYIEIENNTIAKQFETVIS
jgi:hypothetical protein